jgi:phage baseplate assembly protein gpV
LNRITINGKTITCAGNNVVINNGKVIVDGKTIQECSSGDIKVVIEGDVNKIDCGGSVTVRGNAGTIDCGGKCEVSGNVIGDIDAGGSVTCGNVSGDIDAGGSVKCRK